MNILVWCNWTLVPIRSAKTRIDDETAEQSAVKLHVVAPGSPGETPIPGESNSRQT